MTRLVYIPNRVLDLNGVSDGASIYVYRSGTTTKVNLYADPDFTIPVANPYVLSAGAAIPPLYYSYVGDIRVYIILDSGEIQDEDPFVSVVTTDFLDPIAQTDALTPEMFDAVGDGVTDDTAAFAALSTAFNAQGGGIIELRANATYIVGSQILNGSVPGGGTYRYAPVAAYPLDLNGCTKGVVIRMNGAKIKCKSGIKYGSFDAGGNVYNPTLPFYDATYAASPFFGMIRVKNCSGGVAISNGELDGNINSQTIGGQWGDTGYQIGYSGFTLDSNTSPVIIENIYCHHFGQDGGMSWNAITDAETESKHYPVILRNCRSLYNGRQGWSNVGGSGFYAYNCDFSHTGKNGAVTSAPGAGVDMEAEVGEIRKVRYYNCRFENNTGVALLTVEGTYKVEDVEAHDSTFIGTTGWALWAAGNRHRFYDCQFTGAVVHIRGNTDHWKATQFHNCKFVQGLSRSPTGVVYDPGGSHSAVDCGSESDLNVLFNACTFDSEDHPTLAGPFSGQCIYRDCRFAQRNATATNYPRGKFEGRNFFTTSGGAVFDLTGSTKYGSVTINGVEQMTRTIDGTVTVNGTTLQLGDNTDNPTINLTPGAAISYSFLNLNGQNNSTALGLQLQAGGGGGYLSADSIVHRNAAHSVVFNTADGTGFTVNTGVFKVGAVTAFNSSGVLQAASFPALTGDVTTAGASLATTIAANAVTYAKFQQVAASSLVGNPTGSLANAQGITLAADHSFSGTTLQLGAFTGDITKSAGSLATTIAANAVTYAKMQDVSATQRVVGRNTAGAGDPEEVTASQVLDWIGATQGQILYRGASGWSVLATGTSGQFLKTQGAAANPVWADAVIGVTTANGVSASLASGNLTFTLGAITPSSVAATGAITSSSASAGIGYATGAGGTVTQITSRTTGVTINKICGAITLVSAAGSSTYNTFTVTNSSVAATDVIEVSQKSGANLYNVLVTAVAAGSFNLSVSAVSGTATESPVINFIVHKAVTA